MSKSVKNDQNHDFVKNRKKNLSQKKKKKKKSKNRKKKIFKFFLILVSCAKSIFFFCPLLLSKVPIEPCEIFSFLTIFGYFTFFFFGKSLSQDAKISPLTKMREKNLTPKKVYSCSKKKKKNSRKKFFFDLENF